MHCNHSGLLFGLSNKGVCVVFMCGKNFIVVKNKFINEIVLIELIISTLLNRRIHLNNRIVNLSLHTHIQSDLEQT